MKENPLTESNSVKLEDEIENHKISLKRMEALDRLKTNTDFQYLIEQEWFVAEASNTVKVKSSEIAYNNERLYKMNEDKIVAIGTLQRWFGAIDANGMVAQESIDELEKMKEEDL